MASLKSILRSTVAGPDKDFLATSKGFHLYPSDRVIIEEAYGHDPVIFYRDLERDDRVRTVLSKRYTNVLNSEIVVTPGKRVGMSITRRDRKAAERMQEHIETLGTQYDVQSQAGFAAAEFPTGFDAFSMGMLDAILMGFSVCEAVWDVSGNDIYASQMHIRDQRKFRFSLEEKYYGLNLITNEALVSTEQLPPMKFIINTWGSSDDPYGKGLGHSLYWPVFFKRHDVSYWMRFLEKHGLPTVVGKHAPGAPDDVRNALFSAGKSLQSDSVVVIPDNEMLEFLELAHTSISSSGFDKLLMEMNKAITILVLGSELSTDIQAGGSRAASETHSEEEKLRALNDERMLSEGPYRKLSMWTTTLNDEQAVAPIIRRRFPANENLVEEVGIVKTIFDMGFDPSEEFINRKFGAGQGLDEADKIFTKREEPTTNPQQQNENNTDNEGE